jgi:hypothetical protein
MPPGRELHKWGLQLMDPDLVKSRQLFIFFRLTHREGPPRCEHNQWTVAKISHGMRLGCALFESIATRRGHKRFGWEPKPMQCGCLIGCKSRGASLRGPDRCNRNRTSPARAASGTDAQRRIRIDDGGRLTGAMVARVSNRDWSSCAESTRATPRFAGEHANVKTAEGRTDQDVGRSNSSNMQQGVQVFGNRGARLLKRGLDHSSPSRRDRTSRPARTARSAFERSNSIAGAGPSRNPE